MTSRDNTGLCPNGSPVRSKKHRPRRQLDHQPVLERHHARKVLATLTGWQQDTALVQLTLGARFGEIAGLTRHDVNLDSGLLYIRRRYSAHSNTVRATKNHRRRTLEIPRLIVPTLETDHSRTMLPSFSPVNTSWSASMS